ncbi:hypothetical protein BH20ACT17_BH20ACT17_16700 [soil metagenome]
MGAPRAAAWFSLDDDQRIDAVKVEAWPPPARAVVVSWRAHRELELDDVERFAREVRT